MGTLVLVRHGESQWNLSNRFTGWVDVPLSKNGAAQKHATICPFRQIFCAEKGVLSSFQRRPAASSTVATTGRAGEKHFYFLRQL